MFKKVFSLAFYATLLNLTQGSIFTDPIKLTRLVKFQLRLYNVLNTFDELELLTIPHDVFFRITR